MPSETYKKIYLGTITSTFIKLLTLAGSLFTVPLFLRAVGVDHYGVFIVISSFVSVLSVTDLGITSALTNQVSYYFSDRKFTDINKIVSAALAFYFLLTVFVWLGVFIFFSSEIFTVSQLFNLDAKYVSVGEKIFYILLFFGAFNILYAGVIRSFYYGINEIPRYNFIQSISTAIYILIFAVFLYCKPGLFEIVIFQGVTTCIKIGILLLAAKKMYPWFTIKITKKGFALLKKLSAHSFHFFILSLLGSCITKSDMLVLAHTLGPQLGAVYNVNDKILGFPTSMLRPAEAARPTFATLYKQKSFEKIQALYHNVLRMNIIVKAVPLFALVVYAKEIVTLWVGAELFVGYSLIFAFFISYMLYAWIGPHAVAVAAMSLHKKTIWPLVLNVAINLGVSIYAAMQFGIVGIILGTIVGNLCTNALYMPYLLQKKLDIRPIKTAGSVVSKLIILFVLFWMLKQQTMQLYDEKLFVFIIVNCVLITVYVACVYCWVMIQKERNHLHELTYRIYSKCIGLVRKKV